MNILLVIFRFIFKLFKIVFKIYYFPIKKLVRTLDKNHFFEPPKNILQLIFKLIVDLLIITFSFFLYVYLIIRNYNSYSFLIFIGNSIRLISIILFSLLFLYLGNFEECFEKLFFLNYLTFYLIMWLLCIIFFLLTGHPYFLDIILFKKVPKNLSELFFLMISNWINFFERIIIMIFTVLHIINIFSIIRIIGLFKRENSNIKNVSYSTFLIFYDIFFLTPVYITNILFIFDFIEINKNICFKKKEENKSLYEIIKFEIINKSHNVLFLFAIILTLISTIFFIWRIKKSYKILKDYFHERNIELFFVRYFLNINKAFIQIILLIEIPINYLNFYHLKCIRDINNNKDFKLSFSYKHLITFVQKNLDFVATIFSFLRLITIPFWNYFIRNLCYTSYLYVLFDNTEIIKNYSNHNNRLKLYKITLIQLILNFYIIFSLIIGILNPFTTIFTLSINYQYFKSSINNNYVLVEDNEQRRNKIEINNNDNDIIKIEIDIKSKEVKNIEENLIKINNKNILDEIIYFEFMNYKIFSDLIIVILFSSFIYLPLTLLISIISPWTIKYPYYCLISNSKNSYNYCNSLNKKNYEVIKDNECENLSLQFSSFLEGYKLIFEFILIHLNLIRIVYFWKDAFSSKKTFKELIEEHSILSILELPFIPFIIIFCIIEPWNYSEIIKFFNEDNCLKKLEIFLKLFKIFLADLYVSFMFITLIITLIDAIPCILLLIRSLKKNILKREEDILIYQKNYKTNNFKTELRFLFYKHNRNIFIFFLFIFDILLLVRAVNVIQRTLPFIQKFFKKYKSKIQTLFQFCKQDNSNNNKSKKKANLSQMSAYIVSEISSFLDPYSVVTLSLVNKQLNYRIDTNVTWENIYLNYYKKALKANLNKDLFELFNPDMFSNYKKCCKKAQELINLNGNIEDKSKLRDKIIGFGRIVEEEAIVSIMLIPNLIFIPFKILSYILLPIGLLFYYFLKWLDNSKYFFIFKYDCFNLENVNKDIFLIQEKFPLILILNIYYIIIFIFSSILNIYQWIIKLICCASLKQLDQPQSFIDRVNNLHYKNLLQLFIGFFIVVIDIIIDFIPNIYYIYYYFDGLKSIKSFSDIIDIINAFYKLRLIGKLQIIFGIYGLKFVFYMINLFFIEGMENFIFCFSEIYIYKIIDKINKNGLIFYPKFFFPMSNLCLYINYALKILIEKKKILVCGQCFSNILLNIIGFIITIIPFILSFLCFDIKNIQKIITLFIPLFVYSIINLKVIANSIDKINSLNN